MDTNVLTAEKSLASRIWNFDNEDYQATGLVRATAGPRPPEFPQLSEGNQAIKLDGRGSRIIVDPENETDSLQFRNGDEITLSAWIAPRTAAGGSHRYIVGKGRTGAKGFRKDNQNWALRLTAQGKAYQLSFLFATDSSDDGSGQPVHWHRWTTANVLHAGDGWHHVAVSYRFGDPDSIRGWIDGKPCTGKWDMSGPTTAEPIVDGDQVWIGSSMNGKPGSSFIGAIDSVSIARRVFDDSQIAAMYRRDESIPRPDSIGKPKMPAFDSIPQGKLLHVIYEGLPVENAWPDSEDMQVLQPATTPNATWYGESFLLPRIPRRYDDWGIRSAWKSPVLLRIAGDVELPVGEQRFLLRARSLARLWVDGQLVAETGPQSGKAPSGEEPITPLATPPHPGVRAKGYRQQEVFAAHTVKAETTDASIRKSRVVLELIVGSKKSRTEIGEVTVGIETADKTSFNVLTALDAVTGPVSLAEPQAQRFLERTSVALDSLDRSTRRRLAESQDEFWQKRHQLARQWAHNNPPPRVPDVPNAQHPIDAFISHRIDQTKASLVDETRKISSDDQGGEATLFRDSILPLLKQHCFRCHGRAEKGGLRLDTLPHALKGGESGWPAVVPGDPEQSELILRLQDEDPDSWMPMGDERLSDDEIELFSQWVAAGAKWPDPPIDPESLKYSDSIDDAGFLRRVYLDTVGVPPTEQEAREFLDDATPEKRLRLIDRLLDDPRLADHLVSDWLDLLAENPTLLNTSLNSTGPFRFFVHDALVDGKSIDRLVTELILLRGDRHTGGSAGFAVAGENDSPLAAKAHILASGLLGVELQCARCHDAPFHSTTQEDLFSIAAMLNRKPLKVPDTSRVPDAFFEAQQRESMIEVTLAKGAAVEPRWTLQRFTGVANDQSIAPYLHNESDSRDRLAALITAPENARFPAVIVNRTWAQLIGSGIVPSVNDWEHLSPSHPELLEWLSHQFVSSGYDIRHLMRLIMTSDLYNRQAADPNAGEDATHQFFAAPLRRRLTGEQVVDSMLVSSGRTMECEELTFVHDGRRPLSNRQSLGVPTRAWMFATLNNERDRPSLSLPKARAVVDVLQAFGWNGSRQKPVHHRDSEANVLQPGILANGVFSQSVVRATRGGALADLAVDAESPQRLVDSLFLQFLTRYPSEAERNFFADSLEQGFAQRVVPSEQQSQIHEDPPLPLVHWFNHLRPRANEIQQELERRVRKGPPADPRLDSNWRQRYEDVVWSLVNHDEFVWMP